MRLYITPSWRDAAEGHDAWSMESPDDRKRRSHTLPNGNANLQSYSDEAIGLAIGEKNKPKISIQDKILPQKRRLNTLYLQMQELEDAYKSGEMGIDAYSLYRDIIVAKIQRQEVLYKRAASIKPKSLETDEDSAQDGLEYTPSSGFSPQPNDGYTSEGYEAVGVRFIDELSNQNSLKGLLKFSCKAIRKVVQFSHKAAAYYRTLKEV